MVEEYAYLDGMHTRVKGYVTLALWTYHPGLCNVMRLASMECEHENIEYHNVLRPVEQSLTKEDKQSTIQIQSCRLHGQ